ncbi:MAG: hypothetical protein B1H11_07620 [Desulfobacteraceae bacterium 4484_190.1]|nr:MAG: hypothetical protein B1H11_07620 [Desulfobacteraceae bacterium 4484_190.1]
MAQQKKTTFYDFLVRGIGTLHYYLWWETRLFKFKVFIRDAYQLREPLRDLEVSVARPLDHEELLQFSSHLSPQEVNNRLTRGHICILVKKKGKIIFHGWIGLHKIKLRFRGKSFMLPADTAYFYDIRTDKKYRGGKVFQTFVSYARKHCLRHNILFAFTLVDPKIGLPIRSYVRLVGAHEIFLVRFRRRLGIARYSEQQISEQEARRLSKELRCR